MVETRRMDENSSRSREKTDRRVKFCSDCENSNCNECDKTFGKKNELQSTTFHQIKQDLTMFFTQNHSEMIVDIGCPNSVISIKDEHNFRKSLNKFQQQNLKRIEAHQKFKFGPSGPYQSVEKLRFPIRNRGRVLWADVAIVDANIPMLLGNNILKLLEAQINLLASGNGTIKLHESEILLKETAGGHFTLKVAAIGKLCANGKELTDNFHCEKVYTCEVCGNTSSSNDGLEEHKEIAHSQLHCNNCDNNFFDRDCFNYHM